MNNLSGHLRTEQCRTEQCSVPTNHVGAVLQYADTSRRGVLNTPNTAAGQTKMPPGLSYLLNICGWRTSPSANKDTRWSTRTYKSHRIIE